jgi:hypothetical protein
MKNAKGHANSGMTFFYAFPDSESPTFFLIFTMNFCGFERFQL